jgi:hypothetical protein
MLSIEGKSGLRPDQILFHLLPDDWGNDYWIIFLSYSREISELKS